ncbi:zinc finger and BTB domain-containing protein 7A-like protein [Lates japonicus]|uniref:Zinc finger and BTB domain-containing protein 7A-like protein n=1 Tax=Lates japonicus TaxID=270547 RepID=A0AAD3MB95_LATJO|nr:zinc finger and BTB domain-containing protein 7A-like protein [Lates japonicus]
MAFISLSHYAKHTHSLGAVSERRDEDEDEEGKGRGGKEQGNRVRAREYLEYFQRGAHWSSSCSTPELRDLPTHLHFNHGNGPSYRAPGGPGEYYSPLALASAQAPTQEPEEEDEDEEGKRRMRQCRGMGASLAQPITLHRKMSPHSWSLGWVRK